MNLTRNVHLDSTNVSTSATMLKTKQIMLLMSAAREGFLKKRDKNKLKLIRATEKKRETIKNCSSNKVSLKLLYMMNTNNPMDIKMTMKIVLDITWETR